MCRPLSLFHSLVVLDGEITVPSKPFFDVGGQDRGMISFHMIPHLQRIVTILVCIFFIISVTARVASTEQNKKNDIPECWGLFPRIGISIEYGGYIIQQDNYTSLLRRHLKMDLLQYRRHIFYIEFNERFYLGVPGNKWEFNLMKYDIAMIGYRYDFGDFYLGFLLHHQCNNIIRSQSYYNEIDRERSNTYDLGIEFLTRICGRV